MYMMFIYENKVAYNITGIREDDLGVLYQKAAEISKEIFSKNPHAQVDVKVTMYI